MKNPMPYAKALAIAEAFIASVSDCCDRIEIAGSLRRKKETVGDIEIVAIPKYVDDGLSLLGDREQHSLLHHRLNLVEGMKFKQLLLPIPDHDWAEPIYCDLYMTTPACWGSIFTIRTGSADFSKWLVTARKYGGACPGYIVFKDGRLWSGAGSQLIETPEETDVFKALRLEWIPPEQRIEGRWRR